MPGKSPGPSVKKPAMYEVLKEKGYSKKAAAAISNASVKKSLGKRKRKDPTKGNPRKT